jgi:hypothetical protein
MLLYVTQRDDFFQIQISERNISMLREYSVGISANTWTIMTEGLLFPQFLWVCSCVILCV